MANSNRDLEGNNSDNNRENTNRRTRDFDLTDSPRDQEKLKPDEATIDLPDVRDIPGQEHIHVPPLGELADTTISSDDEEGVGLFTDDEEDETDINMGTEADISKEDRESLVRGDNYLPTKDAERLTRATLDSTDNEGESLNERSFDKDRTGGDLDIPGASMDDRNEAIGAEDEENNSYSLGSESNDEVTEGTP